MEMTALKAKKHRVESLSVLPVQKPFSEKQHNGYLEGLYTADCVNFMASMPDECVDLVLTSPPYDNLRDYKGYSFEFERIAQALYKVTAVRFNP
ncbi:MAG: hypothetical protein Ta2G_17300 [Termitinemataceae bacterium]|nr:MAG: hypothetical protein Ta2G_17300 [Termitinemataceae bacterium]